jgi:hypothetical protein
LSRGPFIGAAARRVRRQPGVNRISYTDQT